MTNRPWSVIAIIVFFMINVVIWLVLALIILLDLHPALSIPGQMKTIMAGMSLMMAVILLVLFVFLFRGNRSAYYFSVGFFAITALLTIFDDVGLSDVVVILLNIIPIILLVMDRKWFLKDRTSIDQKAQPPD